MSVMVKAVKQKIDKYKLEFVGWVGSCLLAFCGAPEMYLSFKNGDSSLSWYFLGMWGFGEIIALIYTIIKNKQVSLLPLLFNYGINIVCIVTISSIKLGVLEWIK